MNLHKEISFEDVKTYHTTAELADVTDPDLVYNLRAKLDGANGGSTVMDFDCVFERFRYTPNENIST